MPKEFQGRVMPYLLVSTTVLSSLICTSQLVHAAPEIVKMELRVGKIVEVGRHPEAEK